MLSDDARHGVACRRAGTRLGPLQWRASRPEPVYMDNPLLEQQAAAPVPEHPPRARGACGARGARCRARTHRRARSSQAADLRERGRAAGGAAPPHHAHLVAGQPSERGAELRSAARRITTPACRCCRPIRRILRRASRCTAPYRSIAADEAARARPGAAPACSSIALRDFRLAGVGLPAERKARFKSAMLELTQLQAKFEENVLDATNAGPSTSPTPTSCAASTKCSSRRRAGAPTSADSRAGCLNLDQPSYVAVVTDAQSPALRRAFYEAWTTRASDQGPAAGRWDNSAVMEDILRRAPRSRTAARLPQLRRLRARHAHGAQRRGGARLPAPSSPRARASRHAREFAELEAFAGGTLEPWDVAFYAERLQRERFTISQEELRPYFPLPRVLERPVRGRGTAVRRAHPRARAACRCGTRTCASSRSRMHAGRPSAASTSTPMRAPDKRSGAWMDECVGRKHLRSGDGAAGGLPGVQLPAAGRGPAGAAHAR